MHTCIIFEYYYFVISIFLVNYFIMFYCRIQYVNFLSPRDSMDGKLCVGNAIMEDATWYG